MNEKKFWKIIKSSQSVFAKRPDRHQERLIRLLSKRKVEEIIMFDVIFSHYMNLANTWEMRAAAHIITDKFSEEFFSDFRGWLISRGKKTFFRVMKKPDILVKYVSLRDEMDWVGYEACALEAYERKTGHELPPANGIKGKKWEEADLPGMLPKLWRKFRR
ncbi:MAG: DUF4240 domain-containing protein [Bacteroidetes bacterium]|nr:DUF4240 domain-containing protein [Bacteroidota bacterium]MCB0847029.1 DUF4240 domain-containing protein [Bacteroidota bacterium]